MTGSAASAGARHEVQAWGEAGIGWGWKGNGNYKRARGGVGGRAAAGESKEDGGCDRRGGDQRQRMACVRPGSCCPRAIISIVIVLRMHVFTVPSGAVSWASF
eukprot:9475189-Pyramimonas_sp.AAC.1